MSKLAPSPAVVAAGSVPASALAHADIAEVLAPLAPLTTPARFQALVAELSSHPHARDRLKRKYAFLRELHPVFPLLTDLSHELDTRGGYLLAGAKEPPGN